MTPNEILLKAADYLEENGWCQRDYAKYENNLPGSPCCVMGAINFVATGHITGDTHASRQAVGLLGSTIGTYSVISWNDEHERTPKQVVAALREAAQ